MSDSVQGLSLFDRSVKRTLDVVVALTGLSLTMVY